MVLVPAAWWIEVRRLVAPLAAVPAAAVLIAAVLIAAALIAAATLHGLSKPSWVLVKWRARVAKRAESACEALPIEASDSQRAPLRLRQSRPRRPRRVLGPQAPVSLVPR